MTKTVKAVLDDNLFEVDFLFSVNGMEIDFDWNQEDITSETVSVDDIVLDRDEIEMLLNGEDFVTFRWEGRVVVRNGDTLEEFIPAYGGEGDSGGVAESGSIHLYPEDIRKFEKIKP